MSFHMIDWMFFTCLLVALVLISFFFRRFAKSVAGFLVAGRNVGRYLGLESDSMAGLGAITILATWQMTYESGFVGNFWFLLKPLAATLVALTGFGIYRFRQTRAMTLGQFVEMRYSKKTRILFGLIAYAAGVLNMGIFPGVGSRFFVYYCGFPAAVDLWGFEIPMYIILMIIMVGAAVIICFNGGQITLVVTNFVQALFINVKVHKYLEII
jgi:SSS family solute:Na+ symporter